MTSDETVSVYSEMAKRIKNSKIPLHELNRRADIVLYNVLAAAWTELVNETEGNVNWHPEYLDVTAACMFKFQLLAEHILHNHPMDATNVEIHYSEILTYIKE